MTVDLVSEHRALALAVIGRLFQILSFIVLGLYAISLAAGLGSDKIYSPRPFAIYAVVILAWQLAQRRFLGRGSSHDHCRSTVLILLSLSRGAFGAALAVLAVSWLGERGAVGRTRAIAAAVTAVVLGWAAITYVRPLRDRIFSGELVGRRS